MTFGDNFISEKYPPLKNYIVVLSFPSLVLCVAFFNQSFFPFSFPTFALFILQLAASENLNGILKNSYLQGLKTNEDTKAVITNHKSKKDRQYNNQKDKQTWVALVEQELLILPEHLSSPPVFSGVRVTRSLALCVCFVDRCLSFCTFSFGHWVVCSSSNYGFWIPLWYLQTFLTKHYTENKRLSKTNLTKI